MRMTNPWAHLILVALLLVFAGSMYAQAAANEQIRFQGRLLDNASAPITVSTSVDFHIYATPTGTTVLWTENHTVTPSGAGVFSVLLGSVTDFPGTVDFSQPLYIGVQVSTDAEMTPRYLLSASSVSHYAKTAGSVAAGNISDGSLTLATGNISLTSGTFSGDGSGLTSLAAAQLTGTVPTGALTGTYTIDINGNATTASSFSGSLVGDVTGTQSATTVATVGGVTAANVAGGATLANNATDASTALAIVRRDANSGFSAGSSIFNTTSGNALTVNGTADVAGNLTLGGQLNISNGAPILMNGSSLVSTATSARNWLLPDASGTLALTSDLSSGALSGSFTSLTVAGTGSFGDTLTASNGFNASATTAAMPATAFAGGVIESFTNGANGFGAVGEATYTGTAIGTGEQIIGTHGLAHIQNAGAGILAIGTGGQSTETQLGDNIGVHAWAMDGGRNAGLFAVANADYTQQLTWAGGLGSLTTAVLGFNNGVGATDYGLYVEGVNNRIVGNLNVTGTITGAVTGTASNASQLNSQSAAFYLARNNHTGALPDAALTGTYTNAITLNNAGNAFTGNGSNLSNVNAAQLGSQNSAFYLGRANHTGSLPDAALTGTYTSAITLNNAGNAFTGNGAGLTGVNAAQLGGLAAGDFLRHDGSVTMTGGLNLGSNALLGVTTINASGSFTTTGNVTSQFAFNDESFLGGGGTDGRLNVRDSSGTNRAFLQATGGGGSMELIDNAGLQQVLATSGGLLRVGPLASGGTTNGFLQLNDAAGVSQITADAATGNFTTSNGNIRTTNGNLLSINGELQLGGVTAISNARVASLTGLNLNGGNLTNGGSITATSFTGDGSALTGIVASNASQLGGVAAAEYLLRNGTVAMTGSLNLGSNAIIGAGNINSGGNFVTSGNVTSQYAFNDESFLGGGGTDGRLNVRDGSGTNRAFLQATGGGGSMELYDSAGLQQVLATSGGLLRVGPLASGGAAFGFLQLNDAGGTSAITLDASNGNITTSNGNIRTTGGNLVALGGELQLGGVTAISNARAGSLTSLNLNGGNLTNGGSITATSFTGDGSALTGIVASNAAALGGVAAAEYLQRDGSVAMTGTLDAGAGVDVSGGPLVLSSSVTIDLTSSFQPIDPTVAINYITNPVFVLDFSSTPGTPGQMLLVVNQDPGASVTPNGVPGGGPIGSNRCCWFVYDGTVWRQQVRP